MAALIRDLVGKDVETYAFADGRLQIRWKGVSLPYRVFDKNQRVTHTIFFTTALLMLPALGAGLALSNPDTPLWQFQVLAFLSGIGGGIRRRWH